MSICNSGAVLQIARQIHETQAAGSRDNRYVRGSSIGYCCRMIGYSLLGYQPMPTGSYSQLVFDVGQSAHDIIQKRLCDMGWIKGEPFWNLEREILDWRQTDDEKSGCELEVLNHELRVLGHLDGITVPLKRVATEPEGTGGYEPASGDDPEAERFLVEIKTISGRRSAWTLAIRDGGRRPLPEEQKPAELVKLDWVETGGGKIQRRLQHFEHARVVTSAKFGSSMKPVFRVRIGGQEEMVTLVMDSQSESPFAQLRGPKREHIAQATLYASEHGLKSVLFIYIGKEVVADDEEDQPYVPPIKVYEHQVDPIDVVMLHEKLRRIYERTDDGDLPDRDYSDPDEAHAECRYCRFKWQCWPGTIDLARRAEQLAAAGLAPLVPGPGVTHTPCDDLTAEYAVQRPE